MGTNDVILISVPKLLWCLLSTCACIEPRVPPKSYAPYFWEPQVCCRCAHVQKQIRFCSCCSNLLVNSCHPCLCCESPPWRCDSVGPSQALLIAAYPHPQVPELPHGLWLSVWGCVLWKVGAWVQWPSNCVLDPKAVILRHRGTVYLSNIIQSIVGISSSVELKSL